jgi:hypothetical protein
MSFYASFEDAADDMTISGGSYSGAEMKESLERIRSESKGSAPMSEAKGSKDLLDAAKVIRNLLKRQRFVYNLHVCSPIFFTGHIP